MLEKKFDYSKLKGRIMEKIGTQKAFAESMGWSERTTSLKLSRKIPWTQLDIEKAMEVLGLESNQIPEYFFNIKVQ